MELTGIHWFFIILIGLILGWTFLSSWYQSALKADAAYHAAQSTPEVSLEAEDIEHDAILEMYEDGEIDIDGLDELIAAHERKYDRTDSIFIPTSKPGDHPPVAPTIVYVEVEKAAPPSSNVLPAIGAWAGYIASRGESETERLKSTAAGAVLGKVFSK